MLPIDLSETLGTLVGDFLYAAFLWLYNLILPFIEGFEFPTL